MSELIDLTSSAVRLNRNFTISCGLVSNLQGKDGAPLLAALRGHPGSTIFVFEKKSGQLLRTLESGSAVGLGESWLDWLRGIEYAAFAVSTRRKQVKFVSDFHCANVTLNKASVSLEIEVANAREIALDVNQGGDPVLVLCETVKAKLHRHLNSVRLRDIRGLPEFNQQVFGVFDSLQVSSPTLRITQKDILIEPPRVIVDANAARFAQERAMEVERGRIERVSLELDLAGVKDPHIRLMLSDLARRSDTLQKLLDVRVQQFSHQAERQASVLQDKLDIIRTFFRNQLTEHTSSQEVEEMLRMVDRAEAEAAPFRQFKILDTPESTRHSASSAWPPAKQSNPRNTSRFRVIESPPTKKTVLEDRASNAADLAEGTMPTAEEIRPPRFQARSDDSNLDDEDAL